MDSKFAKAMVFLLLATHCQAGEFLEKSCTSIIPGDLANTVEVRDIDGDGRPNILLGTRINGNLINYVYQGADCSRDWSHTAGGWSFNTRGNVKSIIVKDINADGRMQVLVNSVGSSHASSPPQEYLFVIGNTGIMDWRFLRECGLTNSVDAADLTGSGISNVIMGSRSSRVCAIKDEHRDRSPLIWSYAAGNPVEHIMADDFTADEESEVAGYAGRYMQGKLFMLDSNGNEMWSDDISGGVFTGINPSDVIKSASLSADGSKSIVIGTFNSGLIAYSANGKRLWDFETGNLISAVAAYDINKDGYDEIIVGSAPNVYILDRNGKEIGRFRGDSEQTIYSISAADIDKDGKKEIAIGATRSIYVIDHEGTMLGQWRYTVEIQGVEKTADERAADAVSVVMTDLDSDGMPEIVAVWNWEQSTIRGNQYSATLIVYEINPEYALTKEQKETEKPGIKQTTTTKKAQVVETTTTVPAAIIDVDEDADEEADGGICCMPFLPAILAAALALFMRVPMAADR